MAGLKGWQAYIKALDAGVTDITNNAAYELKDKCQDFCPVASGKLKAGYDVLEALENGDSAFVTNDVEYHDYVDNGTEKMAPRAMTKLAIASLSKDARKYLK